MDERGATSPSMAPLRLVAPLFFWAALIFALSAYPKAIIPQGKYISWDKLAHALEFGILGYLLARAAYFSGIAWLQARYLWITLLCGILYAASDEWHQLYVPGRYASVYDVVADAVGILLGTLLFSRKVRRLLGGGKQLKR